MKRIGTKIAAAMLLPAMVLSMAGCSGLNKLGKDVRFFRPEKNAYIQLNRGWNLNSGHGYCQNVYEKKYSGGSWCATGRFTYTDDYFLFTSGAYKGKGYTKSEMRLTYNSNRQVLYVFDQFYR